MSAANYYMEKLGHESKSQCNHRVILGECAVELVENGINQCIDSRNKKACDYSK